jgi:type VI protein secretion system component VasF
MTSARHQRSEAADANLVQQWADLLELLQQGVEAVATSAEDMAQELPRELVSPVNQELQQRGSSFQVVGRRIRTGGGPRPGGPHAPAARAASLHRCG